MGKNDKNVKVAGAADLVRDTNTKAIINTNKRAFQKHKERKLKMIQKENEITKLKNEVNELRVMLEDVINKINTPNTKSKKSAK